MLNTWRLKALNRLGIISCSNDDALCGRFEPSGEGGWCITFGVFGLCCPLWATTRTELRFTFLNADFIFFSHFFSNACKKKRSFKLNHHFISEFSITVLMQTNSFLTDLFIIQIMYSTDCYHHPIQRLNNTISELAGTHSSYQSTTLAYKTLTFLLECYIKTVISTTQNHPYTSFLTRAIFSLDCVITFIVLLVFFTSLWNL